MKQRLCLIEHWGHRGKLGPKIQLKHNSHSEKLFGSPVTAWNCTRWFTCCGQNNGCIGCHKKYGGKDYEMLTRQ